MNTLFRRLLHLLRWSRHDADLREEIEAHRALRQDALERDGLAPDDAAHASRRALGNVALAVDDARDVWAMRTLDSLWQDVRAALRGLRKSPGFALVAIGTLALGIGANTALFSIFSSLILRPLPVRDPGSLALLTNGSWSYPIWEEIRARETELFDGAFAWSAQTFDLSASGQSDPVDGAYVSGRLFDVLGVTAIRGRMITPADDGGAAPDGPVAVISHRLWRQRFAGASDVVGRQLTVQRVPFTIVGVMPPGFFGPDVGRMTDVMLPFAAEPLIRGQESRLASEGSWWLQIMVRLKPGQSLEQANAALRAAQPQIVEGAHVGLVQRAAHAGTGCHRQLVAAQALRDAALRDGRGRGARAARRVRQHRQSAARAGAGATPRAQRAPGAGELTLADRAAALHRESDRGRDRCRVRAGVREVEQCAPRAAVEHVAEHRVAGPRTRLARARVHGGSCVSLGDHRWRGPRARAEERHPGRGAQGRGPRDCGRPPLCRAQHARRRPDCRVARPGRRGGTVPAHVCVAQPVAARLRAGATARRGVEPPGERRAARGARCARRAPARRGGGGARRAFGIRLRDTAAHRGRLVKRHGRHRRWADGTPEAVAGRRSG